MAIGILRRFEEGVRILWKNYGIALWNICVDSLPDDLEKMKFVGMVSCFARFARFLMGQLRLDILLTLIGLT